MKPAPKSTQLENGYTPIANNLLEAILAAHWTHHELKVILAICRETFGWSRKDAYFGKGDISRMTGIDRKNIWRACRSLQVDNVIAQEKAHDPRGRNKVSINKNFSTWRDRFKNPVEKLSSLQRTASPPSVLSTEDRLSSLQRTASPPSVLSTEDSTVLSTEDTSKQENNGIKSNIKTTVAGLLKKAVDKSDKKARLVSLLKGREKDLYSKKPLDFIDEVCVMGFDRDLAWAYLIQCRDKQNPPGWFVNALTNPRYAPADWAFEQAREERRKLGL